MRALICRMLMTLALAFAATAMTGTADSARASTLVAKVDLSKQRMQVYVDGRHRFTWKVSTGKEGWNTKPGAYQPYAMKPFYYSKKWNMELPYLVWIDDTGVAIHGTTLTKKLGRTASHGCIRLHTENARTFYSLVKSHGMWNTTVLVYR